MKFSNNELLRNNLSTEIFDCLTHHSYFQSSEMRMLVDVQGSTMKLTDPQFNTHVLRNGEYGREENHGEGDLGEDGMDTILKGHECKDLCRSMGIAIDED